MPKMYGLTATSQIIEKWPPEELPRIIAMTAYAMQGDSPAEKQPLGAASRQPQSR